MEEIDATRSAVILAIVIAGDLGAAYVGWLMVRKYREAQSQAVLYMALPVFAMFAVGFFVGILIGATLYGGVSPSNPWDIPWAINIALATCFVAVNVTGALFYQKIFRPNVIWAKALLVMISSMMILSLALPYFIEDAVSPIPAQASQLTKWLFLCAHITLWVWGMYECFSHWRIYKGELKRGKDLDPLVINRFFVWGISAAGMLLMLLPQIAMVPGEAMQIGSEAPWMIAITTTGVTLATLALIFAWFPPGWYRKLVTLDNAA